VLKIPQSEEKYGKVMRGRKIHDDRLVRNKGYLRRRLGAVDRQDDVYLTMPGLRGRIDEVLLLDTAERAPLDYKFAEWKERLFDTYRIQLSCYGTLIEHNYPEPVRRGFLVYVRSKNKVVEVPIGDKEKEEVRRLLDDCRMTIERNYFPKATSYKKRCVTCTYRNICIR
jgi:CRISPR-associated exonuclease Cas4